MPQTNIKRAQARAKKYGVHVCFQMHTPSGLYKDNIDWRQAV